MVGTAAGAVRPRAGRGFAYLLVGAPLGVVAFAVAVTGFLLGAMTAVVGTGPVLLAATLRAGRALAAVERRATEAATGRTLPPHFYRPGSGVLRPLADPQQWRDLLHAVLGFPVRVAAGILAPAWALAGIAGLLCPAWVKALPGAVRLPAPVAGLDSPADLTVVTAAGIGLLATLPLLVRGLVAVRAALARAVLTNPVAALRARPDAGPAAARATPAPALRPVENAPPGYPQHRLLRLDRDLAAALHSLHEHAVPIPRPAAAASAGIDPAPVLSDRGDTTIS
ncbi:MAG: sensor domain-containing protein [Pseudonocardia sp.]